MSDADRELFRSHFLNADQLADREPNTQRADAPNEGKRVEQIEKEVDGGWLNVRVGDGDWASVHELSPVKTDRSQQGRIADATPPSEWSERPSYSDPVADGMDPTAPDSPESQF